MWTFLWQTSNFLEEDLAGLDGLGSGNIPNVTYEETFFSLIPPMVLRFRPA